MSLETDIKEMKDRMRRVETRITKFLETLGFDTEAKQPFFHSLGQVHIASEDMSLKKIMRVLPEGSGRGVQIVHEEMTIAILSKDFDRG